VKRERIRFPNGRGEQLAAALELPDAAPRAYALFAHCFTCSKDVVAASRVSRALVAQGLGVLRFDFTGLGSSEGDFANENFSSNIQDLLAAVDTLRSRGEAPQLLVGHSLGGAAVIAAAGQIPEARAVATIGAPAEPTHLKRHLQTDLETIESEGSATIELAGRPFRIKKQFVEDLEAHNVREDAGNLKKALLVMHSPVDHVVGIEQAGIIYEAARHPKSFVSLDDADHLLTRPIDSEYVGATVAAWASRYLSPARTAQAAAPAADLDPGEVQVCTSEGKFSQTVVVGKHVFRSDEPKKVGGDDAGPGPYDLLLAGLGACTSMTIKMYADRKKWPVEQISVRLRHDRVAAEDCDECEGTKGRLDRIRRFIRIEGRLDDAQLARLMEIADRCPVHRTLRNHPEIFSHPEK
jgi:putative redox protein